MVPTPSHSPRSAPNAPLDEHDALPAGTRFGELEILRVLGVGGFGIVYLAQDHALERQVALKEYMPCSLAGRGRGQMVSVRSGAHTETYALGLRSFVNEARLLAHFNHPSLVKVYRFWEENGTAYMVMPFLQGQTLRDARRAMSQAPSERWIRSVIDPMLDALDLLHREDVYHRDIAPDNIFLPPGELPVLLDFGAARRAIGDSTQTFTAILKPSYAPIEQYAEVVQLRQGPWTDLYALGAVAFYLLRGVPPPPATARAVQDDETLLIAEENPGISPQFLAAIEWALAIRPANRPQNIAALRDVLEGRAEVPEVPTRGRTGTVVQSRTESMPTVDESTIRFNDESPDLSDLEQTRPVTSPPGRTTPQSAHGWALSEQASQPSAYAATQPHQRTRPEPMVMPLAPTIEAPTSSRRWGVWAVAGIAAVIGAGAMATWLSGNRPSPGNMAGEPRAAAVPADPAALSTLASVQAAVPAAKPNPAESSPPDATASPSLTVDANVGQASVKSGKASTLSATQALATVASPSDQSNSKAKDNSARNDETTSNLAAHREERWGEHHQATAREDMARTRGANVHPLPAVPPTAEQQSPATPREACGGRVFLALALCMEEQCQLPLYQSHRQCVTVREMVERRRRAEAGG